MAQVVPLSFFPNATVATFLGQQKSDKIDLTARKIQYFSGDFFKNILLGAGLLLLVASCVYTVFVGIPHVLGIASARGFLTYLAIPTTVGGMYLVSRVPDPERMQLELEAKRVANYIERSKLFQTCVEVFKTHVEVWKARVGDKGYRESGLEAKEARELQNEFEFLQSQYALLQSQYALLRSRFVQQDFWL
jgi:hypothetical protein